MAADSLLGLGIGLTGTPNWNLLTMGARNRAAISAAEDEAEAAKAKAEDDYLADITKDFKFEGRPIFQQEATRLFKDFVGKYMAEKGSGDINALTNARGRQAEFMQNIQRLKTADDAATDYYTGRESGKYRADPAYEQSLAQNDLSKVQSETFGWDDKGNFRYTPVLNYDYQKPFQSALQETVKQSTNFVRDSNGRIIRTTAPNSKTYYQATLTDEEMAPIFDTQILGNNVAFENWLRDNVEDPNSRNRILSTYLQDKESVYNDPTMVKAYKDYLNNNRVFNRQESTPTKSGSGGGFNFYSNQNGTDPVEARIAITKTAGDKKENFEIFANYGSLVNLGEFSEISGIPGSYILEANDAIAGQKGKADQYKYKTQTGNIELSNASVFPGLVATQKITFKGKDGQTHTIEKGEPIHSAGGYSQSDIESGLTPIPKEDIAYDLFVSGGLANEDGVTEQVIIPYFNGSGAAIKNFLLANKDKNDKAYDSYYALENLEKNFKPTHDEIFVGGYQVPQTVITDEVTETVTPKTWFEEQVPKKTTKQGNTPQSVPDASSIFE